MAEPAMIVIGASAGGVAALQSLLSRLPAHFHAAVCVVLHRASDPVGGKDSLPTVLSHRSDIVAEAATGGGRVLPGHIYVAPPDVHLLLDRGGIMRLESSPRETRARARPSIDVLFRSAALAYGKNVIGVLLTGLLDDGMAGLWQIRKHGGLTIVQDPAEARYPSMPESALSSVAVRHTLPLDDIAATLIRIVQQRADEPDDKDRPLRLLIVEDERIVALNLEENLRGLGYDVVGSVSSGEAALDAAALVVPDFALMDVHLSGTMKGTEAARLLWERNQVPSIFLTAFADDQVLDDAKRANLYGYIVKPFRAAQVHAAIQVARERYQRERMAG